MDPKEVVEKGYDAIAEGYLGTKNAADPLTLDALNVLAGKIPPGAAVLDLGCGAGVPATQWLAEQGYSVTGVDISARQLELAQKHVPGATFIKSDMGAAHFEPDTFSAVVSFFALMHVPRDEQPLVVRRVCEWLKPGGYFLLVMPVSAWEGHEENWAGWGATMWWSHYGADITLDMLTDAGFKIATAEAHRDEWDGGQWLWILAQRPPDKAA